MFNPKHRHPVQKSQVPSASDKLLTEFLSAPSAFDKLITELISIRMGIPPEQVTTEFIHVWREEKFYPTAPFEVAATYSAGCNGARRRALTGNEVLAQSDRAKAFFRKLSNGNERE